jgi:hypothetical protein
LTRVHPGWRDEGGNADRTAFHSNGFAKTIATVGKEEGDWRGIEQQVADARAIAAIPALLAELTELRERPVLTESMKQQAEAWEAVHTELCRSVPNWATGFDGSNAISRACSAIRGLAAGVAERRARDAQVAELVAASYPIANYQWPNEKEWERFRAAQGAAAAAFKEPTT